MRGAHPFTLGSCHVSQTCHTNHTRIELAQISGRLHLLLEMCMLVLSLQTCLLHDGSFSTLPICHLRSPVLQQQRKHHSLLRATAMFRWSLALSGALNRSILWQASMLRQPFA